jgi:hypothetical protein
MELPGKTSGHALVLRNGPGDIVASHPFQEEAIYAEGGGAMIMLNQ